MRVANNGHSGTGGTDGAPPPTKLRPVAWSIHTPDLTDLVQRLRGRDGNTMYHALTLVRFGRFDEVLAVTNRPKQDIPAGTRVPTALQASGKDGRLQAPRFGRTRESANAGPIAGRRGPISKRAEEAAAREPSCGLRRD